MAWIIDLDTQAFVFFNQKLANTFFDALMPVVTNDWLLRALFLVIVACLAIFGKKEGRISALLCIITVAGSDLLSSQVIKPMVGRIRPCHILTTVRLLVDCGQGMSFPSSHAVNTFSLAAVLTMQHRRWSIALIPFAVLVSYSRVAVGVHYPLDVVAGAIIGSAIGVAVFTASQGLRKRHFKR